VVATATPPRYAKIIVTKLLNVANIKYESYPSILNLVQHGVTNLSFGNDREP